MVFPQPPLLKSHSLTTWARSLAGCNLSSAPHLAAVLLSGSLPPWMPVPDLSPRGRRHGGPCLCWSKLSLATGTIPSHPSCYQSAITFPLFDFFFPQGTVRDGHNCVCPNPVPPACSLVGEWTGAWSPHDGLPAGRASLPASTDEQPHLRMMGQVQMLGSSSS